MKDIIIFGIKYSLGDIIILILAFIMMLIAVAMMGGYKWTLYRIKGENRENELSRFFRL